MLRCLVCLNCLALVACGATPPAPPAPPAPAPAPRPAPAPKKVVSPVQARVVAAAHPLVQAGHAQAGDIVLHNRTLTAVVAAPARGAVDGGLRWVGWGEAALEGLAPVLDPAGRRAVRIEAVEVVQAEGASAIVRARGVVADDPDLRYTADYVLNADGPLRIRTALENRGAGRNPDVAPGWLVRWGQLSRLAPGVPGGPGQRGRAAWVGADGAAGAAALLLDAGLVASEHGPGWSVVGPVPRLLGAKARRAVDWTLYVGGAGLPALVDPVREARGELGDALAGTVVGVKAEPVAGAVVRLYDRNGAEVHRARTDARGRWQLRARRADGLTVVATAAGRAPSPRVPVTPGAPVAALSLGPVGHAVVSVRDELDAPRGALLRLAGPKGATRAVVVGPEGARIDLEPGAWTLTAEAGPLRPRVRAQLEVRPEAESTVALRLPQLIDPGPLVALDLHALGAPLEVAAACRAADVAGFVIPGERAGAPGLIPSRRIDLVAQARFLVVPAAQGGVAVSRGRASSVLAEVGQRFPGAARFVLSPRSPGPGYLRHARFDPRASRLPAGGFSLAVDGLEVAAPGGTRDSDLHDLFGAARWGAGGVPLAGSGPTASTACGSPRVWVQPGPLTEALRGTVVASYGPLLSANLGGRTLAVQVLAVPRHRPRVLEIWGDARRLQRVRVPAGKGSLNLGRNLSVPPGVKRVLVRTLGGPAGEDDRAGWATTGLLTIQ